MHNHGLNSTKRGSEAVFFGSMFSISLEGSRYLYQPIFATNGDLIFLQQTLNSKLAKLWSFSNDCIFPLALIIFFTFCYFFKTCFNFCHIFSTLNSKLAQSDDPLVMSAFSAGVYKCGIRKSSCKGLMLRQKSHKELLQRYICQSSNLSDVSWQQHCLPLLPRVIANDTFSKAAKTNKTW